MTSMLTLPFFSPYEKVVFPAVETALTNPDGLLCIGGALSKENLVAAYQQGVFPWYSEGEPVCWWSPIERAIINAQWVHISKSMKKHLKRRDFEVTFDQDFAAVIKACAAPCEKRDETWITKDVQAAYINLFQQGFAHSVEVWQDRRLVGGLYGVFVNNVFCGESMFSEVANSSKVALIYLAKMLSDNGCKIIDCQLMNPYLKSMGAVTIKRHEFIRLLQQNTQENSQENNRLYKLNWGQIRWSY